MAPTLSHTYASSLCSGCSSLQHELLKQDRTGHAYDFELELLGPRELERLAGHEHEPAEQHELLDEHERQDRRHLEAAPDVPDARLVLRRREDAAKRAVRALVNSCERLRGELV